MSRNTSIILGEHFDKFIQEEIRSGRYNSASEIIRNGLRLLEFQKKKIDAINQALVTGEESGDPVEFNNEKFKSRMQKKFNLNA
jgi:antitoxin ParD1/3/4